MKRNACDLNYMAYRFKIIIRNQTNDFFYQWWDQKSRGREFSLRDISNINLTSEILDFVIA